MTTFRKMHGLGNDFAVFDARTNPLAFAPALAGAVADRKRGIGCDQLIVIEKAANGSDAFMRIYNADGGEVESCGNAARCVARLLLDETRKTEVQIDSVGGLMRCRSADGDRVTVDMGAPRLDWHDIPMAQPTETASFALPVPNYTGEALRQAAAVNVGNPHCVLFVNNAEDAPVALLGPVIERHPLFPQRVNVEFVQRRSENALRMRVWERGVGITRACGTGACASVVAAHRRGLTGRNVSVELDGGTLEISWRKGDDHVLMTGTTALSFTGDIDLGSLRGQP